MTESRPRLIAADRVEPPFDLLVTVATSTPVALGHVAELSRPRVTIGRDGDVRAHSQSAAMVHCLLTRTDDVWLCADAGSDEGTYVNDELVAGGMKLAHGDRIRIGDEVFRFVVASDIEADYHRKAAAALARAYGCEAVESDDVPQLVAIQGEERDRREHHLLEALKRDLPKLEELHARYRWYWRDGPYRFYHQSWKVYRLQAVTTDVAAALHALMPDVGLNAWFSHIVANGTARTWAPEHNDRWLSETRPIVEAFFHASYMLEMAIECARELESLPRPMPSGWAALLYLFNIR